MMDWSAIQHTLAGINANDEEFLNKVTYNHPTPMNNEILCGVVYSIMVADGYDTALNICKFGDINNKNNINRWKSSDEFKDIYEKDIDPDNATEVVESYNKHMTAIFDNVVNTLDARNNKKNGDVK